MAGRKAGQGSNWIRKDDRPRLGDVVSCPPCDGQGSWRLTDAPAPSPCPVCRGSGKVKVVYEPA